MHTRQKRRRPGQEQAPLPGHGQNPLTCGNMGDHMIHPPGRAFRHPPPTTPRAKSPPLAGERHQPMVIAVLAFQPCKAVLWISTPQKPLHLLLNMAGKFPFHGGTGDMVGRMCEKARLAWKPCLRWRHRAGFSPASTRRPPMGPAHPCGLPQARLLALR